MRSTLRDYLAEEQKRIISASSGFDPRTIEMHEADYSPWEGRDLAAWPSMTILRGKIVVENGTFAGTLKDGQFLPRKVPEDIRARPAV